jgi:hypothetical protein
VLLGFAFVAQQIAAIFAFLARDGTAATAMAVLGTTWLVVALVMLDSPPGATSGALGLFLFVIAGAIAVTGLTATTARVVPGLVFLVAAVRFGLVGVYELTSSSAWKHTAGIVGLVLFCGAMYAATAAELEAALGRTVLPMGRHGKGRDALDGSLHDQIKTLPTEPGVRGRL